MSQLNRPSKKTARFGNVTTVSDDEYVQESSSESGSSLSSEADPEEEDEDEDETEDDIEEVPLKLQTKKQRPRVKRQSGKSCPLPTILERLTGLTGNPNDPIYQPPQRKQRAIIPPRPRSERKSSVSSPSKTRKSAEIFDRVDDFKKICFTLVIATSMSGVNGQVEWSIVEKVHHSDRFFNMAQAKKLWAWMQSNMIEQFTDLTTSFENSFLEAYDNGRVAAFEDFASYDWASLVRWSMRKCTYPEVPLPLHHEALSHFVVDESTYTTLDRPKWYKESIAGRVRTQAQLWSTFATPVHRFKSSEWSGNDSVLKARSWVRANTATPQAIYDGNQAHDKLKVLGDSIFTSVVGDYVEKQSLRMRKLKRLLPGRNYTFTHAFARRFKRPFDLGDFMNAVQTKKKIDVAFANEDPQNRFYSISRCEEDISLMAIMNMIADRKRKTSASAPACQQ